MPVAAQYFVVLIGLLIAVPSVAGSVYVFERPDGSRLITDSKWVSPEYTLIKTYQFEDETGTAPYRPSAATLTPRNSPYDGLIADLSRRHGVDEALVKAVAHVESGFNPYAISPKGATGLMQLMPGTAARYGVASRVNPEQNLSGGVRYLRDLLDMFQHDTRLALAAYNAGENAVTRYGGIPPYAETMDYVDKVMSLHSKYLSM